jgi:hypothetical protein
MSATQQSACTIPSQKAPGVLGLLALSPASAGSTAPQPAGWSLQPTLKIRGTPNHAFSPTKTIHFLDELFGVPHFRKPPTCPNHGKCRTSHPRSPMKPTKWGPPTRIPAINQLLIRPVSKSGSQMFPCLWQFGSKYDWL